MNHNLETLEKVALKLKSSLDGSKKKKKIALLFALNGVGKTRLSKDFYNPLDSDDEESQKIKALEYNAFFEDLFTWDNEAFVLNFQSHQIIRFINHEGLENNITDNFQKLTLSKILPNYDLKNKKIGFSFAPGDERAEDNVKISRGEESLFVWCVFFTVLETALQGESDLFDELEYVVIDDPVSSIDDTKIITMAIELMKIIKEASNENLKFFITTHHPLFFNVLCNEFKKSSQYLLSKLPSNEYNLESSGDTPFAYHIAVIEDIKTAIEKNDLQKYHFNLFRGVLEKTANFLGHAEYTELIEGEEKNEIIRIINLYSHGKLSDLESKNISEEDKELLRKVFRKFLTDFKWNTSTPSPQTS